MKFFLTLFSAIAVSGLVAQPVIGPADMPSSGQSYQLVQSAGIGLDDPGNTFGEDVLWDYSELQQLTAQVNSYVPVSDAPFLYQFWFNNPALPSFSNHALPAAEFGFELPIPISDIYNFYRADENGYFDCGFAASLSGFPLSGARNPTDRILKFPLEYGMAPDTNSTFFNITIPELANIKSFRTRANSLDGWGTVVTPSGTYEALRVRSVVNGVDTIFVESAGIDQTIVTPETIEYRWLSPGAGLPVLQINVVDGNVTTVNYLGTEVTGLAEVPAGSASLQIFPNPAVSEAWLEIAAGEQVLQLVVTDISGKLVEVDSRKAGNRIHLNTSLLNAGMYRVMVLSDNQRYSNWLLVAR